MIRKNSRQEKHCENNWNRMSVLIQRIDMVEGNLIFNYINI